MTKKIETIEVPIELLEAYQDGYDDLESLASTITCYCEDPEAKGCKTEDQHRGNAKAAAGIQKLLGKHYKKAVKGAQT